MVNLRIEVRKMLWGNAGNRCAFGGCSQRLVSNLESPGQELGMHQRVVGEEAHIRSSKVTGPRHDPSYPTEDLNEYANLILLCPTHHTVIDKENGRAWPVAKVVSMKSTHEAKVDAAMSDDSKDRQQLEVALAARIDRWEAALDLAAWEDLTRRLNWVHPYLSNSEWQSLAETASWLAGVVWPPQYPKLSAAFETHRAVLDLLVKHILDSFVLDGDTYTIRRRHKEIWFGGADGEQRYTEAISEFGINDAVTGALIHELTRSINLVVTAVNEELLPLYRFNDGSLQMIEGDPLWGMWSSHPRYEPLIWEMFPKAYDLSDIKERVKSELRGGDPRNGRSLNIRSFDPSLSAEPRAHAAGQ
ncbi:HNH endonuclease [Microbacterium sp. CCNWLW134]|uniref:HNH endonuclease n=1 Tax=Microbacterium sp. CCNWLW134 TaxID=3122064 RepID=UPI00300F82DC